MKLSLTVSTSARYACQQHERQETMYLEMSMKEDMTLICQVNADMDARDLRFDLRAYSIKETLSICISYSGVVINSSISLLSSEASRTTCTWGARD